MNDESLAPNERDQVLEQIITDTQDALRGFPEQVVSSICAQFGDELTAAEVEAIRREIMKSCNEGLLEIEVAATKQRLQSESK